MPRLIYGTVRRQRDSGYLGGSARQRKQPTNHPTDRPTGVEEGADAAARGGGPQGRVQRHRHGLPAEALLRAGGGRRARGGREGGALRLEASGPLRVFCHAPHVRARRRFLGRRSSSRPSSRRSAARTSTSRSLTTNPRRSGSRRAAGGTPLPVFSPQPPHRLHTACAPPRRDTSAAPPRAADAPGPGDGVLRDLSEEPGRAHARLPRPPLPAPAAGPDPRGDCPPFFLSTKILRRAAPARASGRSGAARTRGVRLVTLAVGGAQVWRAFEELHGQKKVGMLGISNCYDLRTFEARARAHASGLFLDAATVV